MSGMIAGQAIASELKELDYEVPSEFTLTGSLCRYISTCPTEFKPMNANLGILPPITDVRDKKKRKQAYHDRSISNIPMPLD